MESELFKELYRIVQTLGKSRRPPRCQFTSAEIVLVYFWAVVNDRCVDWACQRRNWPIHRQRRRLPNGSTMSRRLRQADVIALISEVEVHIRRQHKPSFERWIDAKPLPIGGSSQDVDAGYGRAAASMAKGYKLYAIADKHQGIVASAICPIQANEAGVAPTLIDQIEGPGTLAGDNAYDSNKLYDQAGRKQIQLIAPHRKNIQGLGHIKHSPFRIACQKLLRSRKGKRLLHERDGIERMFGQLTGMPSGLSPLPNFIRGLRRVTNWVKAKIILFNLWRHLRRKAKA